MTSDLSILIDETVALFHRLKLAAEQVHGEGELSAARRGVLRSLDRRGPQTAPQLAEARPVSRQHIQGLVDALGDEGLVDVMPNPTHKRSHLIRLTRKGQTLIDRMNRREARVLRQSDLGIPASRLREAADVLRQVRGHLESDEWTARVMRNGASK